MVNVFQKIRKNLKESYSNFERRKFVFCYMVILLPVAQFAIFWIYKNISSIVLAFQDGAGNFTMDNFEMVWKGFVDVDKYGFNLKQALGQSITVWLISCIAFPISVITTYILTSKLYGHGVLRICYILPDLVGSIIWVSLVRYMMGFDGPIIEMLQAIGVELPRAAIRNGLLGAEETAFPAIMIFNFCLGIVGNNAVLTGAFSRVPEELFEAAKLDGAGYWKTCFYVAIPCIWSTITMILIFKLCGIFTADYSAWLYSNGTGNPGMTNMGFMLYNLTYTISHGGGQSSDFGYPAALGFVLTCITLPIVFVGRWGLEKIQEAVEV